MYLVPLPTHIPGEVEVELEESIDKLSGGSLRDKFVEFAIGPVCLDSQKIRRRIFFTTKGRNIPRPTMKPQGEVHLEINQQKIDVYLEQEVA